ncbi:MAG: transposase [Caulobacteraceae bacterium]
MKVGKDIDSQAIKEMADRINDKLEQKPTDRKLKKAKKLIETDYLPRMEKYEEQERILEERKSYSKTDHDATFMRMKEDHMKNGQLKPGYNVQIETENQFVIGYSIHQRPGDTSCMKDHIERAKVILGKLPENLVADAGYGSEENYEYIEKEKINGYVKYNTFHKEAGKKWKKDILRVQNWKYDEENDWYICGYGIKLPFDYEKEQKSDNGYTSTIRVYKSEDCSGCPYRDKCVKSEKPGANRKIYINRRLNELKEKARANLNSEKGIKLRSLRPIEYESYWYCKKA